MVNFTKLIGGVVGLSLALAIMPAAAQTTSSEETANADLVLLRERAKGDRFLSQFLSDARQQNQDAERVRQIIEDQMRIGRRSEAVWPALYRTAEMVQISELRGRKLGEMLIADLDNDGAINAEELRATLEVRQVQGVAEAFFSSDQNGDGVLNAEEIRAAADEQMKRDFGNRGNQYNIMKVFDFDDDGALTENEFERAMRALEL